jgi:imidazoleglycerol-phosphate dehydratase/histidinol-phosphatase
MITKKRVLFIDRDGTLVIETPINYQLDSLEKLEFYPGVFRHLYLIRSKLNYELAMVTNQDGLGTPSFPEERFWPVQQKIIQAFKNEGIEFDAIHIDRTTPEEKAPTRKPGTAMLQAYFSDEYDLTHSFVIGDRLTDVLLAKNLGCPAILLQPSDSSIADQVKASELKEVCV